MPPKLVMYQSFSDGRYFSPKYSQVQEPMMANGTALKNPTPLERAALK